MRNALRAVAFTALAALVASVSTAACKKNNAAGADGGAAASAEPQSAANAPALSGFEGEIDLTAKGESMGKNGAPQNVTVFIKNDKVRLDIPEGAMSGHGGAPPGKAWVVYDAPSKKLTFVTDAEKQAVLIDLNQKDAFKMSPIGRQHGPSTPSAPPKVSKTGKKDTVAGYSCEIWELVNEKNEKGELCVSTQNASWFSLPTVGLPSEHQWAAELVDGKHLPLRFIDYGADGKEKGRLEVTKIDKKALQASQFEVPAGYRTMDLSQMMKGIPGMSPSGMPGMPGMPPHMPAHH